MNEKNLPEQVIELTAGKINLEQAELLIQKIRVDFEHPKQWMACFPGINTARCQGLSREQFISVWKLVELAIFQDTELHSDVAKRNIRPQSISGRIQGYILLNGAMDLEISERQQKNES